MFPLLETVLELTFWNGLQLARRITLNRLDVVEPLPFERHFQFWEHPKVAGRYVGTVRRLSELYNLEFRQKFLHKIRWMRWHVIVVEKPVTVHTRVIPKILLKIPQLSNVFVVEGRPERESLLTEVRPPLKRLYHFFIRVLLIHSLPKAFCIIWIVSEFVFPTWKQNLMQISWSCFSVISNNR